MMHGEKFGGQLPTVEDEEARALDRGARRPAARHKVSGKVGVVQ